LLGISKKFIRSEPCI